MEGFRNNWLKSVFAMALLCMMALKLSAFIFTHASTTTDPLSIEKNAEESKDAKEEAFGKSDKKLLFITHSPIDHINYSWIAKVTPVCRYKMQEVTDPPKTVPTPPPDLSV